MSLCSNVNVKYKAVISKYKFFQEKLNLSEISLQTLSEYKSLLSECREANDSFYEAINPYNECNWKRFEHGEVVAVMPDDFFTDSRQEVSLYPNPQGLAVLAYGVHLDYTFWLNFNFKNRPLVRSSRYRTLKYRFSQYGAICVQEPDYRPLDPQEDWYYDRLSADCFIFHYFDYKNSPEKSCTSLHQEKRDNDVEYYGMSRNELLIQRFNSYYLEKYEFPLKNDGSAVGWLDIENLSHFGQNVFWWAHGLLGGFLVYEKETGRFLYNGDHALNSTRLELNDWMKNIFPHIRGLIVVRDDRLLINNEEMVFQGAIDFVLPHPLGVVIMSNGKLLLNGTELLYEGSVDKKDIVCHPFGVIINEAGTYRFYNQSKKNNNGS